MMLGKDVRMRPCQALEGIFTDAGEHAVGILRLPKRLFIVACPLELFQNLGGKGFNDGIKGGIEKEGDRDAIFGTIRIR